MNTLREAAQQALAAMEAADVDPHSSDAVYRAIAALRAALEEPVQEPVAWADLEVRGEDKGLSWTPGHFHKTPLYTAPPQRGLTDEVIAELWYKHGTFHHHFARAIERWVRGEQP